MVSTRSKNDNRTETAQSGDKRAVPTSKASTEQQSKKVKTEQNGKLEVGKDGQIGLKEEPSGEDSKTDQPQEQETKNEESGAKPKAGEDMDKTRDEMKAEEGEKMKKGEDEDDEKALQDTKDELEEPKHGRFLYQVCEVSQLNLRPRHP
jgi:hypothetical protein